MPDPVLVYLVANARFHDTNFARLELLKLLAEDDEVRVRVAESFADVEAIGESDVLVTYTCDLRPKPEEEAALRSFVEGGGRWVSLHASNAILDFHDDGIRCPREYDSFMETMGSRFISHPPSMPYQVTLSPGAESDPLVAGIESFETTDELYLCEYFGEIQPLLETRWTGSFTGGYVENTWPVDEPRLVMYTHPVGKGAVLYLTLGHCQGKYDMRPLVDLAEPSRGSWDLPVFYELLRRSLKWATG
jgi:type 1 glutamine amidotransferase